MPLISTNPIHGMDNMVDSVVTTYGDYVLKAYNRFIMNSENPFTTIHYGFDPIQHTNADGNISIDSMPFMFSLVFQFIEDEETESKNLIQFYGDPNNTDTTTIFINFINWDIGTGPSTITDIVTKKKQLIDCGNGVGIFMELGIFGTPGSGSFTFDVYIYSKIIDPKMLEASISEEDTVLEDQISMFKDEDKDNTDDDQNNVITFDGYHNYDE